MDLYRVTWNRKDDTYTLMQEGITLTAEQARQIATAYNARDDVPFEGDADKLPMLENWIPNENPKIYQG